MLLVVGGDRVDTAPLTVGGLSGDSPQGAHPSGTGRCFLFQTASYFRRKGLGDLRRLQPLLLDRKGDRMDQTDGPEQRKWPLSRHGSSLMSCAAVATGDECSHAGSSGHRGEALQLRHHHN